MPNQRWIGLNARERKTVLDALAALRPPFGKQAKEIDALLASPDTLHAMGLAARRRVETEFSWNAVAQKTVDFYRRLG